MPLLFSAFLRASVPLWFVPMAASKKRPKTSAADTVILTPGDTDTVIEAANEGNDTLDYSAYTIENPVTVNLAAAGIKGKLGENVRSAIPMLPLYRQLTTIHCDVEPSWPLTTIGSQLTRLSCTSSIGTVSVEGKGDGNTSSSNLRTMVSGPL